MTADEARQLSGAAQAQRDLRSYLATIERIAKEGGYTASFGSLDEKQMNQFRTLGYKVIKRGGDNTEVSWSVLPLT